MLLHSVSSVLLHTHIIILLYRQTRIASYRFTDKTLKKKQKKLTLRVKASELEDKPNWFTQTFIYAQLS